MYATVVALCLLCPLLKTPHNALDRLIFEDLDDAERRRVGSIVGEYLDGVGLENQTFEGVLWAISGAEERVQMAETNSSNGHRPRLA